LGQTAEWAERAIVEAGPLKLDDWKCEVIEPAMPYVTAPGKPHRPLVFRREVEVGRNMKEARLYITAHGVYEAAINGRKVGDHILAPGWTSYGHWLVYQTFDFSEHLVVGSNTMEVDVTEGWYFGKLGRGVRSLTGAASGRRRPRPLNERSEINVGSGARRVWGNIDPEPL
jgi:alpha-L-rhamnosidase